MHALIHEIRTKGEKFPEYRVQSVFLGGGTPSILKAESIGAVMAAVKESFHLAADAEISIEVNPGTVQDPDTFTLYRKAGINRLSIGLQTIQERLLKTLGRIHTLAQFEDTWNLAKKSGFTNLNVDVMAALPGESLEEYRDTLSYVCALNPSHISAYSLIIEEGTPFYEKYRDLPENEDYQDLDREMYAMTKKILGEKGYHRYEISNYAKPGMECYHNSVYWTRGEYLGLGLGASSLIGEVRYKNGSDLEIYLGAEGLPPCEEIQPLSRKDQQEEFFFLGLRMTEGVREEDFLKKFGCSVDSVYGRVLEKNEKDGLLVRKDGRIFLTLRGLDLSNYVFAQFL